MDKSTRDCLSNVRKAVIKSTRGRRRTSVKHNSVKGEFAPRVIDRPIRLDRERPDHKLRIRHIRSVVAGTWGQAT